MTGSWALTGAGLITAAGDSPRDLFSSLLAGTPLVDGGPPLAGEGASRDGATEDSDRAAARLPSVAIRRFDPKLYLKRKGLKDLSRTSQLGCAAASRVAQEVSAIPSDRAGVALGSAWGSLATVVAFERAAHTDGPRFVDPLLFTETVANVPAGQIAIFFGWSAFNGTIAAGTASGLEAIRWAIDLIEEDRADVALAGGGDELNLPLLRTLGAEGVGAATAGSLPYSEGRSGPIGGEGACLLVLEREEHASRRGSAPLAFVLAGAGGLEGAGGPEEGDSRGTVAETLRNVLDTAGLAPGEIDLLVLSGNGSVAGDRAEAAAIFEVFGRGAGAPPVIAPKSILGETWGASGPIGVVAALEVMRTGTIPPRAAGTVLDRDLQGLNLPAETLRRTVSRALVLDAASPSRVSSLVLASAWSRPARSGAP